MLGDVNSIDPLKLFLAVREKGGYESVTINGLWDSVSEEIGLGCGSGCSLKLNYGEYLDILEKLFQDITQNKGSKYCVTDTIGIRDNDLTKMGPQSQENGLDSSHAKLDRRESNGSGDNDFCSKNGLVYSGESDNLKIIIEGDCEFSSDTSANVSNRKRKRECDQKLLHWIVEVAKDCCKLGVEPLPESCKWKSYGNDLIWKQVLLARENMILKRDGDLSDTIWKTRQKMHPSMYEDYTGSHSVRSSGRLVQVKQKKLLISKNSIPRLSLDSHSDNSDSELSPFPQDLVLSLFGNEHKCVRVGPLYQANVPEYTEDMYASDPKWLGECVWPLKNESNKNPQIQKTRNGGKVQEICKCRNPGSDQCVRCHLSMKQKKLKFELGSAFNYWGFDKMGQQVSLSWKSEEEEKFRGIIKSNPHSEGVCFWDEIFKSFPGKSREDLVSYYFNVFVLQRRGLQNRSVEKNIDSDGEESEYGPLSKGFGRVAVGSPASIFHSPNKAYSKAS